MHKQTHSLYKYPVDIVRQYTLIMTITPSLCKQVILSSFVDSNLKVYHP